MNKQGLMKVLLSPCISEKSTRVSDAHRQFVFRVAPEANKVHIKNAVEMMFNVEVDGVRVVNVKGKSKSFRFARGRRANWKKAYVTLKPGFDLDFMGVE